MVGWSVVMRTSNGTTMNRLSFLFLPCAETARGFHHRHTFRLGIALLILIAPQLTRAQSNQPPIRFDQQAQVFRIDAADMSYVLGINEKKQVQTIYWGKRLSTADRFATPHSNPGSSSFDGPINTTRLEFVSWGGGLY